MKRTIWIFLTMAVVLIGLFTVSRFTAAPGQSRNVAGANVPAGQSLSEPLPDVTLQYETSGMVWRTAAINADGTIASCNGCAPSDTFHLGAAGTGFYQVGFGIDVQANQGYSRWVQADTLQAGTTDAYCNTADRAGDATAVWINCQNESGPVDTPFFIYLARPKPNVP